METFLWTGDVGDICAGMAVMRHMGGGTLHIGNHEKVGNGYYLPIFGLKYLSIKPLLECQAYIQKVKYCENRSKATHDFSYWRQHYQSHRSLAESQAAHVGIEKLDLSPWIKVDPSPETKGLVVVARSPRYHNRTFPWKQILMKYKNRIMFIGFESEYQALYQQTRAQMVFRRTRNFLEVAQLIAGSKLFIGNQSSPCWIAMAMGHPLIQETCTRNPDSVIRRPNARFVTNGLPYETIMEMQPR